MCQGPCKCQARVGLDQWGVARTLQGMGKRRFLRSPIRQRVCLPARSKLSGAVHAGIDALLSKAFRQWAREETERETLRLMRLREHNEAR